MIWIGLLCSGASAAHARSCTRTLYIVEHQNAVHVIQCTLVHDTEDTPSRSLSEPYAEPPSSFGDSQTNAAAPLDLWSDAACNCGGRVVILLYTVRARGFEPARALQLFPVSPQPLRAGRAVPTPTLPYNCHRWELKHLRVPCFLMTSRTFDPRGGILKHFWNPAGELVCPIIHHQFSAGNSQAGIRGRYQEQVSGAGATVQLHARRTLRADAAAGVGQRPLAPPPLGAGALRPGGTGQWRGHGAGVARAVSHFLALGWRGRGAGAARACPVPPVGGGGAGPPPPPPPRIPGSPGVRTCAHCVGKTTQSAPDVCTVVSPCGAPGASGGGSSMSSPGARVRNTTGGMRPAHVHGRLPQGHCRLCGTDGAVLHEHAPCHGHHVWVCGVREHTGPRRPRLLLLLLPLPPTRRSLRTRAARRQRLHHGEQREECGDEEEREAGRPANEGQAACVTPPFTRTKECKSKSEHREQNHVCTSRALRIAQKGRPGPGFPFG
eukprot:gene3067-biopygen20155